MLDKENVPHIHKAIKKNDNIWRKTDVLGVIMLSEKSQNQKGKHNVFSVIYRPKFKCICVVC